MTSTSVDDSDHYSSLQSAMSFQVVRCSQGSIQSFKATNLPNPNDPTWIALVAALHCRWFPSREQDCLCVHEYFLWSQHGRDFVEGLVKIDGPPKAKAKGAIYKEV